MLNVLESNGVQEALQYASRGWLLFPCHVVLDEGRCSCGNRNCQHIAKHPRTIHGLKDATVDPQQIETWWRQRWPNSNVGVATGEQSGIFVVDVDGPEGEVSLSQLFEEYGSLPETLSAKTGRGRHLYFQYPPGVDIRNSTGKLGSKIDVRGNGGYVIAPPSRHASGHSYAWVDSNAMVAPAPVWLLELLVPATQPLREEKVIVITDNQTEVRLQQYAKGALEKACNTVQSAEIGERNTVLNEQAFGMGQLIGAGVLGSHLVEGALLDAALISRLPEHEAKKTIQSGLNSGTREPRDLSRIGKEKPSHGSGAAEPAKSEPIKPKALETISLSALMQKEFEPVKWIVPDLLPEGLTLLVGASKIGKSWLALSLCQSVAFGGYAVNEQRVQQGTALYLALEDNQRRLQARFITLCGDGTQGSESLHFATQIERADQGGLAFLSTWLDAHPDCRLVTIDTFQRFRACSYGGRETYGSDYAAMAPLQALAIQRGIAIVLVHHTRKADTSDPFDKISGTTALMGASDCTWLLERARGEANAKLHITGRDVEEHELAMRFDPVDCHWSVIGDAKEVASSTEEREILDLLKQSTDPLGPNDIKEELNIGLSAVKMRLKRLHDEEKIVRVGRGKYVHPDNLKAESHNVTLGHTGGVTLETRTVIPFPLQSHKFTPFSEQTDKAIQTEAANTCDLVTFGPNPAWGEANESHTPSVTKCDVVTLPETDPLIEGDL